MVRRIQAGEEGVHIGKFVLLTIALLAVANGCSHSSRVLNKQGKEVTVQCQPIYGNWCGKGYPAYKVTGYKPDPVDVWDEACMKHDLCYDKDGEDGEEFCDKEFSEELEFLDRQGIPAPHQIINAYNYFKDNKPYRQFGVSFKDIWNAYAVSCRGGEGLPTLFCDVGLGRNNCEISMGYEGENVNCFCATPWGTYRGTQKPADDFQ